MGRKKLITCLRYVWGKGIVARIVMVIASALIIGGIAVGVLTPKNSRTEKQPVSTVAETNFDEKDESSNESLTDVLANEESSNEDTIGLLEKIDDIVKEDVDASSQKDDEKTSENTQGPTVEQASPSIPKPPTNEAPTLEIKPSIPQEEIEAKRVINQGYREFLLEGGEQGYYKGVIFQFGVIDMNGDGVDELLLYTYDPNGEQDNGPDLMMTYDGEVCGAGQGFGVMSNIEYCVETKYFIETRYNTDGSYDVAINEFDGAYFGSATIIWKDNEDMFAFHVDKDGKYSAAGGPGNIYYDQKFTDEHVTFIQQKIKEYLPSRTRATAPYSINEENLNKYLPIDDKGIIEQLSR